MFEELDRPAIYSGFSDFSKQFWNTESASLLHCKSVAIRLVPSDG